MKILIIGLGNPILSDDGVGWKVVDELEKTLNVERITFDRASLGGLSLMEQMVGYDRVILIDSMETGRVPVGTVQVFALEALTNPSLGHSASAHDTSLRTALETGQRMGLAVPREVQVVAIEAAQVYEFSEELSPAVAAAVPVASQVVFEILAMEKEPA